MIIRNKGVVHIIVDVVLPVIGVGSHYRDEWVTCCHAERPCEIHARKLNWSVGTYCGLILDAQGRPRKGRSTCLTCLASVP